MESLIEDFIDIHFNGQLHLYLSKKIEKENYNIYFSNVIDDEYWNLSYLKNNNIDLISEFEKIKSDMSILNRKPIIYITSNILDKQLQKQIDNLNLELLYTDVWMKINNLEELNTYKSKLNFSITKVDSNLENRFIKAVMNGFAGDNPEDPYESLSDGYRIALKESFKKNDSEYKVLHYLGKLENQSISTATVVFKKDKAIIYNVTTNKKYKKQGVCKQMMSDIIQDLITIGVKEVCVQTEKGFYTEQVYKNIGFDEFMLGKAYM